MSPMSTKDELRGRFTRWIVITAQNAQKNYLRTEGKRPKTISIDEIELPITDTLLPKIETVSGSFDFAEQQLADAFRELPLMRRRILELLFVMSFRQRRLPKSFTVLFNMCIISVPLL